MKLLSESPISESAEHLVFNEDEKSIYYAAPELRAYLRLPRHYNDAFFLLHPKSKINEMKRRSRHEAPPRP
ncbi:unnamed protein product [Trichobilharzia regenti]|nr:unnamed protein product [Trichobilharzia regenti]